MSRRRSCELGAAFAAALFLSACGGGAKQSAQPPTLSRTLASSLAAQSDAVAEALTSGDACRALTLARDLQQQTVAAINGGRVSAGLQEQLSSAVNALVVRVKCVLPPVEEQRHDHGKHKGRDKKKHGEGD